MPTSFLSAIPGLSNIPNPLNIFNGPDGDQDEQRNNNASSPPQSNNMSGNQNALSINTGLPGASRLSSILTRSVEVMTGSPGRITSTPSTAAPSSSATESTEPLGDANRTSCPRTDTDGSGSSSSSTRQSPRKSGNVVIADAGVDSDGPRTHPSSSSRRRGLSEASRGSGNTFPGESRRRRRVETFVLVKPPPTSAKNPLNLQVQLVVPARSGRPRGQSDASKNAPPTPSTIVQTPSTIAGNDDLSSSSSTPARQSFETPETVQKVTSATSDGSTPVSTGESESSSAPGTEEGAAEPQGTQLRRRSSTGSQNSGSAASNSSSASGKRIVPLYNLAVHNVVQPSVVTDAGTDSKVAKFLKRTLDIAGVGQLEPSEVWLPSLHGNSPRPSFDTSGTRGGRPASMVSNMSLLSPAVSRIEDPKRISLEAKSPKLDVPQEDGAKKFFGKLFKKKPSNEPLSERRLSRIGPSKSATIDSVATTLQVPGSPSASAVHFTGTESAQLGHPTFGLSPAVISRVSSEGNLDSNGAIVGLASEAAGAPSAESDQITFARTSRPVGYTWTVRRWAKKTSEGWATQIVTAAAAGLDLVAGTIPADGSDDVVFEWVKMRLVPSSDDAAAAIRRHPAAEGVDLLAKRGRRLSAVPSKLTPNGSPNGSPAGSKTNLLSKRRRRRHRSIIGDKKGRESSPSPSSRRVSGSTKSESSGDGDAVVLDEEAREKGENAADGASPAEPEEDEEEDDEDDGYESDPEDSETPWICSLYVKRTGHRQLLATLTPAPHHPKVVGVLKIPTQLRPVCLANIPAPNTLAPGGKPTTQNDVATRLRDEVALTEENLKDVVNVTAMWLVAREEFSGFGARKDKRKA